MATPLSEMTFVVTDNGICGVSSSGRFRLVILSGESELFRTMPIIFWFNNSNQVSKG